MTRSRIAGVCLVVAIAVAGLFAWKSCGSHAADGPTAPAPGGATATDGAKARAPTAATLTTIGGRVTRTSDGAGIANALVSVAPAELMAMFVHSSSPTLVARTDATGAWTAPGVRPGAYIIGATAAGFLPGSRDKVTINVGESRRDLDLALVAGGTVVSGIVTDVGGGPIADARITAHAEHHRPRLGGAAEFVATTGADGKYAITLPDGELSIEARHDDYTADSKRVEVAGKPQTVDFKLVPGAVIHGQVIARDTGKGVAGAIVFAEANNSGDASAFADDDGNFTLRGLASGSLELKALGRGYASAAPTGVAVGIGEQVDGVRVLVDRAYSISGKTVKKPGGEPIAGITLGAFSLLSKQLGLALQPSDKDGSFEIVGLRPGSYLVFAVGEGAVPEVGSNVDVVDKDVTGVVVPLEIGVTIAGRVEPPLPHVDVTIELAGEIGLGNMFEIAKTILVQAETDGDGAFALTHVAAGAYTIRASGKEGHKGSLPITVAAVEQRGLVVKLETRASIAGRVIDTSGNPAVGVSVTASPTGPHPKQDNSISFGMGSRDTDTTAADGSFRIVGLDAGKYRVTASNGGMRFGMGAATKPLSKAATEVELAAGAAKAGITLTVEARDGVIEGVVIGPDRKPASDAWVTARRTIDPVPGAGDSEAMMQRFGSSSTPVLTGADGRFKIDKLLKGSYALEVEGARGATHAEKPGVSTGDNVTIELLALGTITGVVSLGGAPVPKYVIECGPTTGDRDGTSRQIDAKDGAFSIERLAPGKYKCSVEADAGTAEAVLDVSPGSTTHDFPLAHWATITGTVVGVLDKHPVAGIHVFAGDESSGRNLGAMLAGHAPTTDASGRFLVDRVSVGSGKVTIMPVVGFAPLATRPYTITEGQRLDVGTIEIVPPRNGDAGTFGLTTKVEDGKVIVDGVTEGGPAAAAGVVVGDRITAIATRDVAALTPEIASLLLGSGSFGVGVPLPLALDRNGTAVQVVIVSTKA